MACWMLASNLRFWRKLRKARIPYRTDGCSYPVYLVEQGLSSPCLFGLVRPAIYLTPAATSPERLRHVIAHEETHARHLDPLWSALRCVCLLLYWFDPLVWAAAIVSKTDCELACDEGALRRLGESERIPYGQTLLSLIPVTGRPADPLLSATTMTAGKHRLKDRITRIAENRQTRAMALFAVAAAAILTCLLTFTGVKGSDGDSLPVSAPLPASPTAAAILPDWEPEHTFPLSDLTPYEAPEVTVERHTNDLQVTLNTCPVTETQTVVFYRSTDGSIYAGILEQTTHNTFQADCFLQVSFTAWHGALSMETYQNILGRSGFRVTYPLDMNTVVTAYYYMDDDGAPRLLFETTGDTAAADMDGDVQRELIWQSSDADSRGTWLLLRSGDTLYQAHAEALLRNAYPDWTSVSVEYDALTAGEAPCLFVSGAVPLSGSAEGSLSARRRVYFDGSRLLVYKNQVYVTDHVSDAIDAPMEAVSAAKAQVLAQYELRQQNDGTWDDWRVTRLDDVPVPTVSARHPEIQVAAYDMGYELHTATPEAVSLAGGTYVDEDGWTGGLNEGNRFLIFLENDDGARILLDNQLAGDLGTDAPLFCAGVAETLVDNGILQPSEVDQTYLVLMFYDSAARFLNRLGQFPASEQAAVLRELVAYRDNNRADPTYFDDPMEALRDNTDGLTEAGAAVYRQLLELSDQGGDLPAQVRTAANTAVRQSYENARADEQWAQADWVDFRVETLVYVYTYRGFHGMDVEVYRMNYAFLSGSPEHVMLVGGMYQTEEGWVCPTYPDCTYLFFQLREDGTRTYLCAAEEYGFVPGDQRFTADMERLLPQGSTQTGTGSS
jgi:hypothetical protein